MTLNTLENTDFTGKIVLVRVDFNVPMKDGEIQDETRITAALPTLKRLKLEASKLVLMTHLGRPKGEVIEKYRTHPIAKALGLHLGTTVLALNECVGTNVKQAIRDAEQGQIILLENTRFHPGEAKNDSEFSKALADLADVFVNDAFGTAHRAHSSTVGVTEHLPSYAGLLLQKEIEVLESLMVAPARPLCMIVGGAKIDTKIGILESFVDKADSFLIGGALANTFLGAQGAELGKSLFQEDKFGTAQSFLGMTENAHLLLDAVVSEEISMEAEARNIELTEVCPEDRILDIGTKTVDDFIEQIKLAKTIIWNGPMGLYEYPAFAKGTKQITEAIAASDAVSVLGGGDTIDAVKHFGFTSKDFTHISTGGGAMLEFLEGKVLPGVQALSK
jgi:phosphoglycerate kinase